MSINELRPLILSGGTLGMSLGNRIAMDQGRGDAQYAQLGASIGEIAGGLAGAFEFGFSRPCLAGASRLPRVSSGLLTAAPDLAGTVFGGAMGWAAGGNVEAALEGIQLGQAAAQRAFSVYQWTQYHKVCFAAGTPLLTPDGHKLIEQFRAGDRLLTRDEHDPSAPVLVSVVEEMFVNTGRIMSLHVGGQVIRTTPEHPFWVQGQGWTAAGALQAGDRLSSHNGQWMAVEEVYDTGEYETVYNLRVADFHTYFVGCQEWGFSVWAHNQYELIQGTQTTIGKNSSYDRVATPDKLSTSANRILQKARTQRGLPVAGSDGDTATLSTIRVVDPATGKVVVKMGSIIEGNAHGLNPPNWKGAGAVSPTHAEAGTLFSADSQVKLKGKDVTVFTDRDPCSFCDNSRGIENIARKMGAASLTVYSPSGTVQVF